MAQRKFDGGIKEEEREALVKWAGSIEEALNEEERAIADLRKKGREWLEGDWKGREHGMHVPCLLRRLDGSNI
jgi:hypothetical protein